MRMIRIAALGRLVQEVCQLYLPFRSHARRVPRFLVRPSAAAISIAYGLRPGQAVILPINMLPHSNSLREALPFADV